jgi:excisionase family DNA binding protein
MRPGELISVKAFARAMGVSDDTVRRMCQRGEVEHLRLGSGRGRLQIPVTEMRRVLRLPNRKVRFGDSQPQLMVADWHKATGIVNSEALLRHIAVGVLVLRGIAPEWSPWAEDIVIFQHKE